jgi:flagellar biosynthesis protein FlhB
MKEVASQLEDLANFWYKLFKTKNAGNFPKELSKFSVLAQRFHVNTTVLKDSLIAGMSSLSVLPTTILSQVWFKFAPMTVSYSAILTVLVQFDASYTAKSFIWLNLVLFTPS